MITFKNLPRRGGRYSAIERSNEIINITNGISSYISSYLVNFEFKLWDMRSKNGKFWQQKGVCLNKSKTFTPINFNNNLEKWSIWESYSYRRGTNTLKKVITRLWNLIGCLNQEWIWLSTTKNADLRGPRWTQESPQGRGPRWTIVLQQVRTIKFIFFRGKEMLQTSIYEPSLWYLQDWSPGTIEGNNETHTSKQRQGKEKRFKYNGVLPSMVANLLWEKWSHGSYWIYHIDIPRISLGILNMRVRFPMVLLRTSNNIITQEDRTMGYLFLKVFLSIFLDTIVLKFQIQLIQPTRCTPNKKQYCSTCLPSIRFLDLAWI